MTLEELKLEMEMLGDYLKKYYQGAYPAFYLQLHTPFRISNILELRLGDLYELQDGVLKMKDCIKCGKVKHTLSRLEKRELTGCVISRIPVRAVRLDHLNLTLCYNKLYCPLLMQNYRKIIRKVCNELNFKHHYRVVELQGMYGFFEIATGYKTIAEVAKEYSCNEYVLKNRIFGDRNIDYAEGLVESILNFEEDSVNDVRETNKCTSSAI